MKLLSVGADSQEIAKPEIALWVKMEDDEIPYKDGRKRFGECLSHLYKIIVLKLHLLLIISIMAVWNLYRLKRMWSKPICEAVFYLEVEKKVKILINNLEAKGKMKMYRNAGRKK